MRHNPSSNYIYTFDNFSFKYTRNIPTAKKTNKKNTIAMSSQNIAVALRGHLSSDARILLPSDDEFGLKLSRWGNLRTDIPAAVVLVKEEKDVLAAVGVEMSIPQE